jgi:16S rRNA (guanine(966)-N(2))-methyltransferase RsmD
MRVIAGTFRSRILTEVESKNTRSTKDRVKEQIFNSIGRYFSGLNVLDLFSGSGSLGIEAISRGVDKCVFVDKDRLAIKVITDNILMLKIQDKSEIIHSLYSDYLNNTSEKFDIIFLDPPYSLEELDIIISIISKRKLLTNDGRIVCLYSKNSSIKEKNNDIIEYKQKISGITKISFMKWGV